MRRLKPGNVLTAIGKPNLGNVLTAIGKLKSTNHKT